MSINTQSNTLLESSARKRLLVDPARRFHRDDVSVAGPASEDLNMETYLKVRA